FASHLTNIGGGSREYLSLKPRIDKDSTSTISRRFRIRRETHSQYGIIPNQGIRYRGSNLNSIVTGIFDYVLVHTEADNIMSWRLILGFRFGSVGVEVKVKSDSVGRDGKNECG